MYTVVALHWSSTGSLPRPLTLVVAWAVAGVLPGLPVTVTVFAACVAQIHGCSCAPENTGPPIGWLVIAIREPAPAMRAVRTLAPFRNPVTKPM